MTTTNSDFFKEAEIDGLICEIHQMLFLKHVLGIYHTDDPDIKKQLSDDALFSHLRGTLVNSFIIILYKLGSDNYTNLSIPQLAREYSNKSPLSKAEENFIGRWRGNWAGHNNSFCVTTVLGNIKTSGINLGETADRIAEYYFQLGLEQNNPHFTKYSGFQVANTISENRAQDFMKRLLGIQ